MAKKQYKAYVDQQSQLTTETRLPTNQPIAIYYRQSTEAQIGNISTTLQTVDMFKYLKQQGWNDENIIMIDMDAGISGTTKIDERPGMSKLFNLITQNKIGAVACQDEDRLFRDVTQIQVNIFIEACKVHRILVITPTMVYNFAHEQLGVFHARQFRFKSEMAAEYINTVIMGKLYAAKRSLAMNGKWAGSPIPVGFMIDMRKKLPNGTPNENWRKLEVFEPYAIVMREYFRLFLSYSGNLSKTLRHIKQQGPYFPDPLECVPPEGYRVIYKIKQNANGWCPKSKTTLIQMLTNATYVGHWIVNNQVVIWCNHPAIIDEATFYRAFNYLSDISLTGAENTNYDSRRSHRRPSKEEERAADYPLLSGLIVSKWDGKWKRVGTQWEGSIKDYSYTFTANDGMSTPLWYKKANYFDATVSALLCKKLTLTFKFDDWSEKVDEFSKELDEQRELKSAQLTQLKTVMDNLVVSLGSISNPQMVAAVENKYHDAQVELDRLQTEIASLSSNVADSERLKLLKHSYVQIPEKWERFTADEKREIIHAFVQRIEVTKVKAHNLDVVVKWKDGSSDAFRLSRVAANGIRWLPQEVDLLIKLMESDSSKLEIAQAFPDVKWKDMLHKYRSVTKKASRIRRENTVYKNESYNEYMKRVELNGSLSINFDVSSPTYWSPRCSR